MSKPSKRNRRTRHRDDARSTDRTPADRFSRIIRWTPLVVAPIVTAVVGQRFEPWVLMWAMVGAYFVGFKWLTLCEAWPRAPRPRRWRAIAYLFASPAMDADAFLSDEPVERPNFRRWTTALVNFAIGCTLLYVVVDRAAQWDWLLAGWCGLAGIAFTLHFGLLHLWALAWQAVGVRCEHIMHSPARATSVSDLWGNRWNLAFNLLVYQLVFRRLLRRVGVRLSLLSVFLLSGLLHETAISLPARGGYGLPTAYFLLQAGAAMIERMPAGRRMGLNRGLRGWLWTMAVAVLPAFALFHPLFVGRCVLPFLRDIGALN